MRPALLIAFFLSLSSSLSLASELPELGDASQTSFSPQQERRIGQAIMRDIRADRSYVDDPEFTGYLNDLGYRLVAASPDNRQDFEFFVIADSTLNAFALPGGFIGVHTGLIQAAQNESELASVLAHEISHVSQHHLARVIAGTRHDALTSLAALAVAILASRSSPQVSEAALATAQATSIQNQLDFTREHEREADRLGLQILEQAGFDVRAMPAFFEHLQKFGRVYDNNAPAYLRTHPLTTERIADIQNRVANLPYRQVADSLEFQLLRAKLRAQQDTPKQAITFFADSLREKRYSSETAARYGLAAALLRAKNYPAARQQLEPLRGTPHPIVENLAAQIELAAGNTAAALTRYRTALASFPAQRALVYGYADALLQNRQNETALKLIEEQLRSHPHDHHLYQLAAQGYAAQGRKLLQHQAQAEAYAIQGKLAAAIDQLQIALKNPNGDFYVLSSVEARLKELRAIEAEAKKPVKGK